MSDNVEVVEVDVAAAELVALKVPQADRPEVARRLLATPAAQDDPHLVRTNADGFVVPGYLFDQAYPEPQERPEQPSKAHPAGKARGKSGGAK